KTFSPDPMSNAYISTSEELGVTRNFGANSYLLSINGGVELPFFIEGKSVRGTYEKEVAVPIGIAWQDVIGARDGFITRDVYGPVFLRKDFELDDQANFWETLQIMGGKPQCVNMEKRLEIINSCRESLNELYENGGDKNEKYLKLLGLNQDDRYGMLEHVLMNHKEHAIDSLCIDLIHAILGLQDASRRR
ncbi:MAG: hypothetical protein KKE11_01980, partial [Gammaproteobacteria bacterium]|nr:hypothetical protein [Gammaproteobacteria bacterium]